MPESALKEESTTNQDFIPPYPVPHKGKLSLLKRFFSGWQSWIHTLFERSYTMKMGEIKLPKVNFYIVNETSLVKKVMEDEVDNFPKHHLLEELLRPLIGESVFSSNGETWSYQRKMMNPAFSHTNLKRVFDNMQQATLGLLSQIDAAPTQKDHTHIDPLMTFVTADIIYRTLFSQTLDEAGAEAIFHGFDEFQRNVQPAVILRTYGLPLFFYRKRVNAASKHIHEVFAPIVEKRYSDYQNDPESVDNRYNDILQALLQARHPKTGKGFSCQELIDQISTIFLAGHETSASALGWALYLLAKSPEWQDALYEEINSFMATDGHLKFDDVRHLPLTRNVFLETLRLYPPVSFFLREVKNTTTMRDKIMKPGAMLAISPWLIQRNKNEWPCPHAFKPERFSCPHQADSVRNAWLPFGLGRRICIGAGFAKQEAVIILAYIIHNYRLSVSDTDFTPSPISRVTLRSKDGIFVKFTKRT